MSSQITPQIKSELDTTSQILNSFVTKSAVIPQDTLDEIKNLAARIVELAKKDDGLDDATRAAFIRYAHRIAETADLYKVTGPQPLLDELDRFSYESRRMTTPPGPGLWEATKKLTTAIVLAVELLMVPVNTDNALEYYGEMFSQYELTEAPGEPELPEIVIDMEDDHEPEALSA
nr:hypothetical protein [Microbacterium bovistercoris]